MKILGIDLGTTNTYIYGSAFSPEAPGHNSAPPEPIILPGVSDDRGSIATVVLYENGKPFLAGNLAESEFYANIAEQPRRRLESQFKPEIAQNQPHAMRAMSDFLKLIRLALPEGTLEEDTQIYVGMPSLSREDFRLNMSTCFREAGWPTPIFARESDAALVSCLQSGILDIDDIERVCAILDFGGGTCDFTAIEGTDVLQNGGDLLYGGRLFDDLFFQVFCRADEEFARIAPHSPYAWYVHWIECKKQKENFSDHMRLNEGRECLCSLHAVWYDKEGKRRDAFVHDYGRSEFVRDAENYRASPAMLEILASYRDRGGLSAQAQDMLQGRSVGLISWLRVLLESMGQRRSMAKVVLTGGSARWFFARELTEEIFPAAKCVESARGYEDIAFGLALFPLLKESHATVQRLLNEKISGFIRGAIATARRLMKKNSAGIARQCAERIVNRDVMPALEAAYEKSITVAQLENSFAENIKNDAGLREIVRQKSEHLRNEIQNELNFSFRQWLKDNGVLLVPVFVFPAQDIGEEFFESVSVKISRLDSLNLMKFTMTTIMPVLAATATAGAIAHTGEPFSAILGGSFAFGATWLAGKTAPAFLTSRKLPKFFLNEKNRAKIVEKNRDYIEKALSAVLEEALNNMDADIERRLKNALESMLGRLSVLNQVKVN